MVLINMDNVSKSNPKSPAPASQRQVPKVKRDAKGRILPGYSLNPGGSRPKNKLKIMDKETRQLVISEVIRILKEGEANKHYQPVLLKVMDKAMPSLKAVQVDIEGHQQLGVIVLPEKKPLDGELVDAEVTRVDDSLATEGES